MSRRVTTSAIFAAIVRLQLPRQNAVTIEGHPLTRPLTGARAGELLLIVCAPHGVRARELQVFGTEYGAATASAAIATIVDEDFASLFVVLQLVKAPTVAGAGRCGPCSWQAINSHDLPIPNWCLPVGARERCTLAPWGTAIGNHHPIEIFAVTEAGTGGCGGGLGGGEAADADGLARGDGPARHRGTQATRLAIVAHQADAGFRGCVETSPRAGRGRCRRGGCRRGGASRSRRACRGARRGAHRLSAFTGQCSSPRRSGAWALRRAIPTNPRRAIPSLDAWAATMRRRRSRRPWRRGRWARPWPRRRCLTLAVACRVGDAVARRIVRRF